MIHKVLLLGGNLAPCGAVSEPTTPGDLFSRLICSPVTHTLQYKAAVVHEIVSADSFDLAKYAPRGLGGNPPTPTPFVCRQKSPVRRPSHDACGEESGTPGETGSDDIGLVFRRTRSVQDVLTSYTH